MGLREACPRLAAIPQLSPLSLPPAGSPRSPLLDPPGSTYSAYVLDKSMLFSNNCRELLLVFFLGDGA